jgi:DNA-binding CsgD family transcriptional regulator
MKTGMMYVRNKAETLFETESTMLPVLDEAQTGARTTVNLESPAMSRLALSHTLVEHSLYTVMLEEVTAEQTRVCTFSMREFMALTQLPNYSAIRRGLSGLIEKLSIEHHRVAGQDGRAYEGVFLVFTPEEIFARRSAAQFATAKRETRIIPEDHSLDMAIAHVASREDLSRREAQVALCCAQGMSNAEIGERLFISEQTVKFHLRHIFVKYGVRRRGELIARLLSRE